VGSIGAVALVLGLSLFALSSRWQKQSVADAGGKKKKNDDAQPTKGREPSYSRTLPTPRRAPFMWLFSLAIFFLLHGGCAAVGALSGSALYSVLAYFNQLHGWVPAPPSSPALDSPAPL
jgi:hypothetical protein